ncbi:Uncharacterised protein [Slackia heliotrinireducens]|uniref:Uncharacterized protein n=1 Tax=Slackia heliotrinireducens (strain ATCC 29202 / DSM 20476 / NCTC 11029 / RHS 1) TaxID=471855 RepID=C7N6P9_SLAHD|nr:hypothetical protein [Slackia heliotrinireducens]ACV22584.1 hypothetical protein Shel_15650 [Slackia heliotrinireducens DSM 20476]VEH01077.1 Uncharacterised protein [Slackia heliotrinireducens]
MVSLGYIREQALRLDTAVAMAFRRALGLRAGAARGAGRRRGRGAGGRDRAYRGLDECRRQTHGVVWRGQ